MAAVALQDAARDYLHQALGVTPSSRPWSGSEKLPYYLQDQFELHELRVGARAMLLALNRRKRAPTPSALRAQLDKLKAAAASRPIVYVTGALASYERKRLIEHKVPFIVPGNQLYLPDLGIDLREYFRRTPREPTSGLRPATQAMMLRALLSKSTQTEWNPAAMAREVGYTAMTVSRVVSELTHLGIATLVPRGRVRWLHMTSPPAEIWELIRPLLRTPIKRQFWARTAAAFEGRQVPLAGLSALACYSKLSEPATPVYAVGVEQLKLPAFKDVSEIPEPVPDGVEVQVWSYVPILGTNANSGEKKVVDPLSLSLSLQEDTDERVESALEELKEHFPW